MLILQELKQRDMIHSKLFQKTLETLSASLG